MKNRLPQYWAVKCDGSQKFRDTVIKYLNETYNCSWNGIQNGFYGYDGCNEHGGTNGWDEIESFQNNPVLLTIDEFVELSKPIPELSREQVRDIAEKAFEWYETNDTKEMWRYTKNTIKSANFLDHYFKEEKEEQTLDGKIAIIENREYELKLKG